MITKNAFRVEPNFKYDTSCFYYSDISSRGWTEDGQYFYKMCDKNEILNEILGMHLAELIDLKTAIYKPAIAIKNNKIISSGIMSKDITNGDKNFYTAYNICKENKIPLNDLNLDKFHTCFKDEISWLKFMKEFLKLISLDFYMNQVDRSSPNLPFFKTDNGYILAPIFDYSASMDIKDTYDYSYTENYNWFKNKKYVYGNVLILLVFPSEEFYKLLYTYPELRNSLNTLYNADIINIIVNIISETGLKDINIEALKRYDEAKKQHLSRILNK